MKDLVSTKPMIRVNGDQVFRDDECILAGCREFKLRRLQLAKNKFFSRIIDWAELQDSEEVAIGLLISEDRMAVWFKDPEYWTVFYLMFGDCIET